MAAAGEPPPLLCPLCGHPTSSAFSPPASTSASASPARPPLMRRTAGGPPEAPPVVVRVEISDEAVALREALARQQAVVGDLQSELDAERGAAAGAASEAMTMILRLQREKAEAMMEARQFRRYAEEKMAHDAVELAALEEALAKRDAAVRAFQAAGERERPTPRHPSAAWPPSVASTPRRPGAATPRHPPSSPSPTASSCGGGYYPPLQCCIDHPQTASEADALETPHDQLTRLAHRIHLLERGATPMATTTTTPIIRVAPGSAFLRHARAYSADGSLDFYDGECFPDDDDGDCGTRDRVYTVDAIHGAHPPLAVPERSYYSGSATPVGSDCCGGGGGGGAPWAEDEEVRRLSSRMQALEADRESMRQAIVSMGVEKALLKEIAQKLCKEAAPPAHTPAPTVAQQSFYKGGSTQPAMTVTVRPPRHPPVLMQRKVVNSQAPLFAAVVKWVTSIMWWRKTSSRVKYPIGQCGNNVGLLLLLSKTPMAAYGHQQEPPKRM